METVRSPDAGTDLLLAARSQLVDDLWIGHMSPRHTDYIDQPRIDRISCCRNIGGLLIRKNSYVRCARRPTEKEPLSIAAAEFS